MSLNIKTPIGDRIVVELELITWTSNSLALIVHEKGADQRLI